MPEVSLAEFVGTHREEILRRCRTKPRPTPPDGAPKAGNGLPLFLEDMIAELNGVSQATDIETRAASYGADLFLDGVTTIAEVVHTYGAVCQSVTGLAVDTDTSISSEDFKTLNRCLDDAIASAVSEYSRRKEQNAAAGRVLDASLTSRNLVEIAINGFESLQTGSIGVGGSTGGLVHRSLLALRVHLNPI